MKETENIIVMHSNHNYQMFLRDQFANSAMQAIINAKLNDPTFSLGGGEIENNELVAIVAYSISDAMLKQREL